MKNYRVFVFSLTSKAIMSIVLVATVSFAISGCASGKTDSSIHTLIVGGGSSHDFDRWYKQADAETLEEAGLSVVTYTSNTDSIIYYLPEADVLYLSNNQPIDNPAVRQAIFNFVSQGNGLVLAHAALWYNWSDWPEYNAQLVSGGSRGHDPYGNFTVTIENSNHPITQNVDQQFSLKDELYYYKIDTDGPGIEVLATASAANGSDKTFPSVFTVKHNSGKIVGLALGHDAESHNHSAYQTLLRNAVRWAAKK